MNARKYAYKILLDIEQNNAFSNIAVNKELRGKDISSVDRRLIRELVYGVLENKIYLDFIISKLSNTKMNKMDRKVIIILRIGLYQIIFLDKIPAFAAVSESVNIMKKINPRAAGFTNGILRNYLRNQEKIKIPSLKENLEMHLSIQYSHPLWLVKKWLNEFGQDFTMKLLKANNETPKLSIRVNTLKTTKEKLIKMLQTEGVEVDKNTNAEECLHLDHVGNIEELKSYQEGLFQIQDESSMLVGLVLNPKSGECIVDVCAAPGGKTTHIAQIMKNQGQIIARDIYPHKLNLIKENAKKLGIENIIVQEFDAQKIDVDLIQKADRVLVDAPCSGLGIIRRKPELKYNKTPDHIKEITKIQLEILKNASQYVKDNGVLVYSTCTIEKEENIEVIKKFIEYDKNFEIIDVNPYIPKKFRGEEKMIQLYPHIHHTDGFFICKLRKKS
ncbi:16S rRNA (cytosine(967)-C(5))-methyltransferase RsmB [Inediibacterium massiliense]|uniref:16S rRNA (cytosine(967)-C(5))-methyltransferase RsmB n=1 Tax=Inediibacterium massiliense TaxID=1658111 RepID=UPI0006B424B0|nr:16S rRNA (cytosine(967)-C(5))-methyltransferase RsmB [Inediibacterium massiliense]